MTKAGKRKLFVLILVGLLTAYSGCYKSDSNENNGDTDDDTDTSFDLETDADLDTLSDSGEDTDTIECDGFGMIREFKVKSPDPGVSPRSEDICQDEESIVESNLAARVTLENDSDDLLKSKGQIEIASELRSKLKGDPKVEVLDSFPPVLAKMVVANLRPSDKGYAFEASFPENAWFDDMSSELTIQVTFELICDEQDSSSRQVSSTTYLHLCEGPAYPIWVSSGGTCSICEEAFEPVAVPLPAVDQQDNLPLPVAPPLRIIAKQISAMQVALRVEAEDDSTELKFNWHTAHGALQSSSGTEVVWTLPADDGPHLVQVVGRNARTASISTLRFSRKV